MLQKAVQILEALRASDDDLSIRAIAARTDLSKSSVQRLLRDLVDTQLAIQDESTRGYRLGPRLLALGSTYYRKLNVRQVALPYMTQLRDDVGETVGLTIRAADDILHVEQVEVSAQLRASFDVGRRLPLWSGAPGRLFLAEESDDEIDRILTLRAPADITPIDPPAIETERNEILAARQNGYTAAFEETTKGVNTLSAPIRNATGTLEATLSVTAPSRRMPTDSVERFRPRLTQAAAAISGHLGWMKPRVRGRSA